MRAGLMVVIAIALGLVSCDEGGPGDGGGTCCRVCDTGKACGDSCISRDDTCHAGPGCACNGLEPYDD